MQAEQAWAGQVCRPSASVHRSTSEASIPHDLPAQVVPGLSTVAASGIVAVIMLPLAQIQVGGAAGGGSCGVMHAFTRRKGAVCLLGAAWIARSG